jgi:hypothetical protein
MAYSVATAMRHYIRRDTFNTCRKKLGRNQPTNRAYCIRQAESIVNKPINEEEEVNFVNRAKRSSKWEGSSS